MTIKDWLEQANKAMVLEGFLDHTTDPVWLACHILKINRGNLRLREDQTLNAKDQEALEAMLQRRLTGEPIQYIMGEAPFYGYDFYVKPGVLIPRFETEELVEKVLKVVQEHDYKTFIDVCCGSGCIGLTLAKENSDLRGTLLDISDTALEVSRINAEYLDVNHQVIIRKSDLLEVVETKVDLIVSNPPYIQKAEIETLPVEVKAFEPMLALDGGESGLIFYHRIITEAQERLKVDGCLAFEIGYNQKVEVCNYMEEKGFVNVQAYKDLYGKDRMIVGYKA